MPEQHSGKGSDPQHPDSPLAESIHLEQSKERLVASLAADHISAQEVLAQADLDGCIASSDPRIWSLVNIHFGSGAGYLNQAARQVLPLVIPGEFQIQSVWNALATALGQTGTADIDPELFVRKQLESQAASCAERQRGNEPLHIAVQIAPTSSLIALSLKVPENLSENDRLIWEPILRAGSRFQAEIEVLSNILDELNEKHLATFSLCLPEPDKLIGESIRDTIWTSGALS